MNKRSNQGFGEPEHDDYHSIGSGEYCRLPGCDCEVGLVALNVLCRLYHQQFAYSS